MDIQIERTQILKFAAVFAEAVLTYLDSGEAQWLTWDGLSHRFDFASVEMDEPDQLVLLHVDATWDRMIGEVDEITDPASPDFDLEALRAAIEHQLTEEGVGERILKEFLKRLERIREGGEDGEDPEPPAEEPEQ